MSLTSKKGITQVKIKGLINPEVSIQIPEDILIQHKLNLNHIVDAIRSNAVDIPGGTIRAKEGEILLSELRQKPTIKKTLNPYLH